MNEGSIFESDVIDGDILSIVLRGNLDTTSTREFEEALQRHLDFGRMKIIIDCRNLGFISSLGVGALVNLQTHVRRQGGEVKLAAVQGPVMHLLRLVRLDRFFDFYGDMEFARQSFQESSSS